MHNSLASIIRPYSPHLKLGAILLFLCGAGGNSAVTGVLLALVIVLLAAKIGGDLAIRIGQPEVLGELVVGVLLGNLFLFGIDIFEFLKHEKSLGGS